MEKNKSNCATYFEILSHTAKILERLLIKRKWTKSKKNWLIMEESLIKSWFLPLILNPLKVKSHYWVFENLEEQKKAKYFNWKLKIKWSLKSVTHFVDLFHATPFLYGHLIVKLAKFFFTHVTFHINKLGICLRAS